MSFFKGFVLLMAVAAVWCQECTDNSPDNELTCPELIGLGGGVCDQDFIKRDNFCARSCGRPPCPSVDLSSEGSVTLIGKVTGEKQDAGPPPATTQTAPAPAPTPAPTPPPPPPPPAPVPTPPAEVPEMTTEETTEDDETTETPVEVAAEVTEPVATAAEDVIVEEGPAVAETDETAEQAEDGDDGEDAAEVTEEAPEVTEEVAEETQEDAEETQEVAEEVPEEVAEETMEVAEEVAEEAEEVDEEAEEPEAPVDCKPVLDLIAGDGELSFMKSALDGAGLSGSLAGFNGIIFAPTNAAFEALLAVLDLSKDAFFAGNSQVIQQLLQVHVVPGAALTLDELNAGQSLTPLLGDAQKVSVTEGGAIASPDGKTARIAKSLNEGCPAIIHIIDNVLIPRPAGGVSD